MRWWVRGRWSTQRASLAAGNLTPNTAVLMTLLCLGGVSRPPGGPEGGGGSLGFPDLAYNPSIPGKPASPAQPRVKETRSGGEQRYYLRYLVAVTAPPHGAVVRCRRRRASVARVQSVQSTSAEHFQTPCLARVGFLPSSQGLD